MSSSFDPIAIVGEGCVLPGGLSPSALWNLVHDGKSALSRGDHTFGTALGGYVHGFDRVFDPTAYAVAADGLAGLDPVFLWTLHAAGEALRSAGIPVGPRRRGALVIGNLSYPTPAMSAFARETLRGARGGDGRNRFMSGLPAALVAEAVGFDGDAFALDAACASSLYAIKLACDRLHDGTADVALAGGVNHTGDRFLHAGFLALGALSATGQSRPFHRDADGLVPAQGAAMVALKRLADAEANGDRILGVIRGIGLSNDGRSRNLLVPSEEGQVRAMRAAYAMSGLSPADVSLVECHATGTRVGDATELRSLRALFAGVGDVPIGSLKSNLGHLITASGAAALVKVLGAMRARVRPPTLHADALLDELRDGPLRVLRAPEPWPGDVPRRAAISNFGFGGNNAHLIVEEWTGPAARTRTSRPPRAREEIAIVAMAAVAGPASSTDDFDAAVIDGRTLVAGTPPEARATAFELDVGPLSSPPADLREALAQQLLLLRLAPELVAVTSKAAPERTALLVGMQVDGEVTRHSLRIDAAAAERSPKSPMTAASTLGCMPNVVANRLGHELDLRAPTFSVSAEEASGTVALDLAARSLAAGEIDLALVGAVDLSCEEVQRAAAAAMLPATRRAPGDAAALFALKRLGDARRDGDSILAVLGDDEPEGEAHLRLALTQDEPGLSGLLGHAHAASGLLHVAAAVSALKRRALPARAGRPAVPWLPTKRERRARVEVHALGGARTVTSLRADTSLGLSRRTREPCVAVFGAPTLEQLVDDVRRGALHTASEPAACRVAVVAPDEDALRARIERARELLGARDLPAFGALDDGIYFGRGPLQGELAFVFTGPAGAYPHMGRDLALALPELVDALAVKSDTVAETVGFVYGDEASFKPSTQEKLFASSYLAYLHAELTRGLLGIAPHASIGYCSGETNALFALGAWTGFDEFRRAIDGSGVFTRELAGDLAALRRAWSCGAAERVGWATFRVRAHIDAVRAALASEPRVHLVIVNTPNDVIIAGDPDGCARVAQVVGPMKVRSLGYDMVIHSPETRAFAAEWRALHHRPTAPVPGVRFYTHATCTSYAPTDDAVADALTGQALTVVDFPAMIERAYADGVRVFVEHGPHAGCSKWIDEVLGDRPHLAVSLDRFGRSSLLQAIESIAALAAAGVPMNHRVLAERLGPHRRVEDGAQSVAGRRSLRLRFEAHPPPGPDARNAPPPAPPVHSSTPSAAARPVVESSEEQFGELMAPAPKLPPPRPRLSMQKGERAPTRIEPEPVSQTHDVALVPPLFRAVATRQAALADLHVDFLRQQATAQMEFVKLCASLQGRVPSFVDASAGAGIVTRGNELGGEECARATCTGAGPAPVLPARPPVSPARVPTSSQPTNAPVMPARAPVAPAPPLVRAARPATAERARVRRTPVGPRFDRAQLETLAGGRISSVFGPLFEQQDGYRRQVRMPEPPLLLADRVTGLDAEPGSMATGTIWTETDITPDAWYLHEGHMPAGIFVEAGQADLLLVSWVGIDFVNRDERVYRLLGCELTTYGELPKVGETASYEIRLDSHARTGDVHIVTFSSECYIGGELRMQVRNGQAGFFTDAELAGSGGVRWSAEESEPIPARDPRLAAPAVRCDKTSFSEAEIGAFAEGRAFECFGAGFERAASHYATPTIQRDRMRLVDEITHFDPSGGPWGRGFMRARLAIRESSWFFDGHFKNDPCMPGTLLLEGSLQAMAIYLAAMGYTVARDGWRFEIAPNQAYALRCRGQTTPRSRELVYELFVHEVVDGPEPTLYADVLGTVDGLKAFHVRRLALRLVPGWPYDAGRMPAVSDPDTSRAVRSGNMVFDNHAIFATALGPPSRAFGDDYRVFDGPVAVPRLPNPPFLLMSRLVDVQGPANGMQVGSVATAEYDVPPDAWFFAENGRRVMPFSVLLEVGLQPPGWLATYVGCVLAAKEPVVVRNLDGVGTFLREITDDVGRLTTTVTLKSLSTTRAFTLVSFDVVVRAGADVVCRATTGYGFFTPAALREQIGLPTTDEERARVAEPSAVAFDLRERPARLFAGKLRLPHGERLLMLDRVTGLWLDGGRAKLGRVRTEKDVQPSDWYFKAHFFQDPVQPGSIGLEAMHQALQLLVIERGLADGMRAPRFDLASPDVPLTWKYRGQVVPENRRVVIDLEITEVREDRGTRVVVADASLWCDGKRIDSASGMSLRVVDGDIVDR